MKDFTTHFRELVAAQLPEDSRIVIPGGAPDMVILCTWRLNADMHRPSKRSRMIRILIVEEAIEDYARGSDGVRLASDARLVAWLRNQLSRFDPNHDAPRGVEPPPVTWTLNTLELNA